MSTVATSRPQLRLTLQAAAVELSNSFTFRRRTMHPDLLLQKHGVTSPRLSSSVLAAVTSDVIVTKADMSSNANERAAEDENLVRIDDDDEDDEEEDEAEDDEDVDMERDVDVRSPHAVDDIDAVSLCSDDSELSVGQEGNTSTTSGGGVGCEMSHQQQRMLFSNVGGMMALCPASAFSNVISASSVATTNGGDISDARSSVSTDDAAAHGGDESPNGLQSIGGGGTPGIEVIDPFAVAANALRIPVPVVPHSNTSPFQEEFLRKSHLYAEELMKQQMQFMAAARANAFTLRNAAANANVVGPLSMAAAAAAEQQAVASRQGFRAQIVPQAKHTEMPNFAGIHSHLSAISKMSQLSAAAAAAAVAVAGSKQHNAAANTHTNSSSNDSALARLTALGMVHQQQQQQQPQAATTISVSSLNQLQAQMQAHLPFMHNNNNNNNHNNNNLNEPALKFSIDNILKADFGRRITDPLFKRNGGHVSFNTTGGGGNGTRASKNASAQRNKKSTAAAAGNNTSTSAMDLTSLMSNAAAAATASSNVGTLNFSNSLANICTNSNDSSSTAVSSSYGGGGGNSDFVKSPASQMGATSACSISPVPGNSADGAKASENKESTTSSGTGASGSGPIVWPAWVYCTRYSDRPSSGPRARKPKKPASEKGTSPVVAEDKRPRTAFSGSQLARLKHEFTENRYLTEKRRQQLSSELGLNEAQIKIWFQNKRAKLKKSSGTKNPLALQLMAQGLYNHSTVPLTREEEEMQEMQERENAAAEAAAAAAAGTVSS